MKRFALTMVFTFVAILILCDYAQLRKHSTTHHDHIRSMTREAISHAMSANTQTHPLPALVQTREASSAMASITRLYGHAKVSECLGVDIADIHRTLASRELDITRHLGCDLWPAKSDSLWELYSGV